MVKKNNNNQQIFNKALKLGPVERAELVEKLITSFEPTTNKDRDTLWAIEAEDRLEALKKGELQVVPAHEVFKNIN